MLIIALFCSSQLQIIHQHHMKRQVEGCPKQENGNTPPHKQQKEAGRSFQDAILREVEENYRRQELPIWKQENQNHYEGQKQVQHLNYSLKEEDMEQESIQQQDEEQEYDEDENLQQPNEQRRKQKVSLRELTKLFISVLEEDGKIKNKKAIERFMVKARSTYRDSSLKNLKRRFYDIKKILLSISVIKQQQKSLWLVGDVSKYKNQKLAQSKQQLKLKTQIVENKRARLRKLQITKDKLEQLIVRNMNEEQKQKIFFPTLGLSQNKSTLTYTQNPQSIEINGQIHLIKELDMIYQLNFNNGKSKR